MRRRERTLIAGCNAAALLAFLALLFWGRPVAFHPPSGPEPVSVFDVTPPPPPPAPPPPVEQAEPRRASTARPAAPGGSKGSPPPVLRPAAPAPILALASPSPLIDAEAPAATMPASGTGTGGDGIGQGAGRGSGKGSGDGTGSGAGDGGARFARAIWIEKPTRVDFERDWPIGYHRIKTEVRVLVACYVRPSGRPHRCKVAAIDSPFTVFGPAAVRIMKNARVQPVLRNGQVTDLPVIAPIVFFPPPEEVPGPTKDRAKAE